MAEDEVDGQSVYTWDIDNNYDPGSILDFELAYLYQEKGWPYEPSERNYPGMFEYIEKYWPFDEKAEKPDVHKPNDILLESENSLIWPLFVSPFSATLVEQFCLFLSYVPQFSPEECYIPVEYIFSNLG